MKPIRNILVVKLSSIGDVVMSTPVPRALKERYPQARVCWLVEEPSRGIVEGNPWVDRVMLFPRLRWAKMLRSGVRLQALHEVREFVRELRAEQFDVAIDLQGLLKSGIPTWLSGAPRRIGRSEGHEAGRLFINEPVKISPSPFRASQQYLDLLRPLGIEAPCPDLYVPVSPEDEQFADDFLKARLGSARVPYVTMAPTTTLPHKHWTDSGFGRLIDLLQDRHGLRSVLLGGPRDLEAQRRIASCSTASPLLAAGVTTINQAAALIRRSALLVAVDTGLLFIGLAVRAPTVGLFGPTSFRHLTGERVVVAHRPFPCAPCLRHPTCQDRDCMRSLAPEAVMRAVEEWLREPAGYVKP